MSREDAPRPDPTRRFTDRVESYVRARPGYPEALIPLLAREASLRPADAVADIGSGTGLLSEILLRYGNEVFGVEPNENMRAAAEKAFFGQPRFRSIEGSAEATTLPAESVDLVAAGQAFHWFDRALARKEFGRILRPPRRAVLVWNDRRIEGGLFSIGYEALLHKHGTDYGAVDHKNLGDQVFDAFFRPGGWTRFSLPNEQRFDEEGLRNRLLSSSYTPPPGDPRHAPMLDDLARLFSEANENGFVRMEYATKVYVGKVGK